MNRRIIKFGQHSHSTALWTYRPISTNDDRPPMRVTWAALMAEHCLRVMVETVYSTGNIWNIFVLLGHVLK